MIRTGLCSITFRDLSPEKIVELVAEGRLDGIEWGGDVHVPHGDVRRAAEVRRMTEEAGLLVISYGSYYRAGHGEPVPFEQVLDTAVSLNAPLIRVWAGKKGSDAADDAYWQSVVEDARRITGMARQKRIDIAFEFHRNTLTDSNESARRLVEDVGAETCKTYWQIMVNRTLQYNLEGLNLLLPRLANIHAFYWDADGNRRPLEEGKAAWNDYLGVVADTPLDHHVLLEFVKDNTPEQFLADAATLKRWIDEQIWQYNPGDLEHM